MRKLALSMVAGAGLVLMTAPASAHYQNCGYQWSDYLGQWVYRCRTYYRPYYRPYYYPYPSYYHPYYYPYPYYLPYQAYGPRLHLFFGY